MISALNNRLDSRGHLGGTILIELVAALAILAPILVGTTILLEVGVKYFARAQAAQAYHNHVEPVELLLCKQVRHCRHIVYNSLLGAQNQDPTAIVPNGNFLRCDRMDGAGWFILAWDDQTHILNLVTNGGPGVPFTRSLRLWAGITQMFDISQGFLNVQCSLPTPPAFSFLYGPNTSQVDYLLLMERQQ